MLVTFKNIQFAIQQSISINALRYLLATLTT